MAAAVRRRRAGMWSRPKYGRRLQAAFARPGGEALRDWIDAMPNEQYQSLFGAGRPEAAGAASLCDGAPGEVTRLVRGLPDGRAGAGWSPTSAGTTSTALLDGVRRVRRRSATGPVSCSPTPSRAGACPSPATRATTPRCSPPSQVDALRARVRPDRGPPSGTGSTRRRPAGQWAQPAASSWPARLAVAGAPASRSPTDAGLRPGKTASRPRRRSGGSWSSSRARSRSRRYLVTTAPDVATSTNLAGFINRMGVFTPGGAAVVERGPGAASGRRDRRGSTSSWASAR